MPKTLILWRNETIGFIEELKGEMFEFYGKWLPLDTDATRNFWMIIKSGEVATVQIGADEPIVLGTVVLASFYKDQISIRMSLD